MKQIDHNPHEARETNAIWWILWTFILLGWITTYFLGVIHWHSVFLGAASGLVLASWSIEITGDKVPDSWRRKPPRT
jgi:hypothetical protein